VTRKLSDVFVRFRAPLQYCCGGYKGKYFSAVRPIREESKNLSTLIKEALKKSI
jgi:hypothetical protein